MIPDKKSGPIAYNRLVREGICLKELRAGLTFKMILFILFLILCAIYWCYMRDRRIEKLMEQFPGPALQPIIGNSFNYFTSDLQGYSFSII